MRIPSLIAGMWEVVADRFLVEAAFCGRSSSAVRDRVSAQVETPSILTAFRFAANR